MQLSLLYYPYVHHVDVHHPQRFATKLIQIKHKLKNNDQVLPSSKLNITVFIIVLSLFPIFVVQRILVFLIVNIVIVLVGHLNLINYQGFNLENLATPRMPRWIYTFFIFCIRGLSFIFPIESFLTNYCSLFSNPDAIKYLKTTGLYCILFFFFIRP